MPDDTVYVALRREQAERLLEDVATRSRPPYSEDDWHALALDLRAALDHPVEREEEFRVVGEDTDVGPYETASVATLDKAKADLAMCRQGGAISGRIRSRTVTRTEWRDVEEADHDQA